MLEPVAQKDLSDVIDCREVKGCENMKIQGLSVSPLVRKGPLHILVHGNAQEGLLVYNLDKKELVFRCVAYRIDIDSGIVVVYAIQ